MGPWPPPCCQKRTIPFGLIVQAVRGYVMLGYALTKPYPLYVTRRLFAYRVLSMRVYQHD